jgi:iron complex transport system ATP-binding protein
MITVNGLEFSYGNTFHLRDITFDVPDGDFLGVIGPNGSGKSTLLKLLSKVAEPTGGRIEMGGKRLNLIALRSLAQTMAVVGSEAQFAFPFPVQDVVMMGRIPFLGRFGSPSQKDRRKVEESLEKTEAGQFRDRFVHELSSGERQRVMLARALAQEPQILLLDEPTAHLDLHYEIEIFKTLKWLNEKENLTVIAVSHNLNLITEFCKRVMVLQGGLCRRLGTPREVVTAELLQDVFRIQCRIDTNPFSKSPTIVLNTGG